MNVVKALTDWLGSFRLTITGGEPFMKAGILDFLEFCTKLGLPTVVITNGFCFNSKNLHRLVSMRLAQVVVSIDSLDPDVHNKIRGLPNAYQRTWETICFLAAHHPPFVLGSSTVIMNDNILELGRIATTLADIGVRRIFFQPIQGGFTSPQQTWPYDGPMWPTSRDHVEKGFDLLLKAKSDGLPIVNSEKEILDFKQYFLQGSQWLRPWACPVGYTTFHCDAFGHVRMCVPYPGNIGSLRNQHPSEIWNSALADCERKAIRGCQKACLLNCTRQYTMTEKINYSLDLLRDHWGK